MKTSPRLAFAAFALLGLGLTGCTNLTPAAQTRLRIQEKAAVFQSLSPRQQDNILGGAIERNDTGDMVYMAMGKPSKIVTSADGIKAMWIYKEYYQPKAAFTTSYNSRDTTYIPSIMYDPKYQAEDRPMQGPTPGFAPANDPKDVPYWQKGIAFSSTRGLAPMQSLDIPDMQSKVVYVFFFRGKVVEIKLDGDSSDQRTVAANVAPNKVHNIQ